jgi:hypothetical protein
VIEDPDEFMAKMKRTQGSGAKKNIEEIPEKGQESENEYSWDPDFD